MTKKQVREARKAYTMRVKELMRMSSEQLQEEVRRAFPIVSEATEKEALQYLILDALDLAFPDPVVPRALPRQVRDEPKTAQEFPQRRN